MARLVRERYASGRLFSGTANLPLLSGLDVSSNSYRFSQFEWWGLVLRNLDGHNLRS